jgi:hypothetical protein
LYPEVPPVVDIKCYGDTPSGLLARCHDEGLSAVQSYANDHCIYQIAEAIFSVALEMNKDSTSVHPQLSENRSSTDKYQPKAVCSLDMDCIQSTSQEVKQCVCVVSVDHMHNRKLYLKHLNSWCGGLEACTVITSELHYILVVLVGRSIEVEKFLQSWKTQNVDVDSRGRPCKERMMTVLCKEELHLSTDMAGIGRVHERRLVFNSVQCNTHEIENIFKEMNLTRVFQEFVVRIH